MTWNLTQVISLNLTVASTASFICMWWTCTPFCQKLLGRDEPAEDVEVFSFPVHKCNRSAFEICSSLLCARLSNLQITLQVSVLCSWHETVISLCSYFFCRVKASERGPLILYSSSDILCLSDGVSVCFHLPCAPVFIFVKNLYVLLWICAHTLKYVYEHPCAQVFYSSSRRRMCSVD